MSSRREGRGHALQLALSCFLVSFGAGAQPIRDGGINPANLGKGDWIYFVSAATNRLGGSVPSVVNIPTLMAYYKSVGMQYVIVKAGTGSTNFNGSGSSPQFNSNLVHHAHAAGLLIFAYTRSYDDDVQGEINMAERCFALGADGWVIDAEAEWESGASQAGTNGPARATQYGQGLRALFPNKFIAHAPFPIITFHSSFPYKEFGLFCDTVMPQAYWRSIYDDDPNAVSLMFTRMDNEYRNWQNSLTGIYTNAVKPLAPIAQAWSPSATAVTTGADIDEFFDRLRTNVNPASVTGYKGISFWRADLKTSDIWSAINTNALGDAPGPPNLTMQPQSRTVLLGSNVTFTAWGTGSKPFYYRWRFNGTNLSGAASPNLVLTNVQPANAGAYSAVVSNISGVVTSAVAFLNVTEPPTLFNVSAVPGARQAIISWMSTNPASSRVEFGLTAGLGTSVERQTLVTSHSVLLAGLIPDTNYFFSAVSRVGLNTYRSDGWSFSTAGDLIFDNTDATYTGTWTTGTTSPDKFGADYRFAGTVTGGSTASAIYTPLIITPGNYDVFVWYPQGGNRSTSAPVTIFYNGGALTQRVNQESGGGGWRLVGSNLNFRAGTNGFVRIHNGAGESDQVVLADAVRFAYRADQDTPAGPTVPDWWAAHYFGGNVNPVMDPDGDGYPTWAEYLIGTAPTDPASRLLFSAERFGPDDMILSLWPPTDGRAYRLQEMSGSGSWVTRPDLLPVSSGDDRYFFAITNAMDASKLFRLRVEWTP